MAGNLLFQGIDDVLQGLDFLLRLLPFGY